MERRLLNNTKDIRKGRKKSSEVDLSRRGATGKILGGIAALALGDGVLIKKLGLVEAVTGKIKEASNEIKEVLNSFTKKEEEEILAEMKTPTTEQTEIEEDNKMPISQLLDYDTPGRIKISRYTIEALTNYWKERYGPGGKSYVDLVRSYSEMELWGEYHDEAFEKRGVDPKYKYLAIPESHWDPQARSGVGAVGPFQFMRQTALECGLKKVGRKRDGYIDERKDPIKSAEACARFIRDHYKEFGDMDLVLAKYNGGFVRRYKNGIDKENKRRKKQGKGLIVPSYDEFLQYMEDKINKNREHIATRTDLTEKQKKEKFEKIMRGYAENLNYPAKFNAVIELIEAGVSEHMEERQVFKSMKAESGSSEAVFKKYKIARRDNWWKIYRNIYQQNPKTEDVETFRKVCESYNKNMKMHPGEVISIPVGKRKKPATLATFSKKHGINLALLKKLNPSFVTRSGKMIYIPFGEKIRVLS